MTEKKMTLNIAGKDYVLNFGVNWFYEFYKQDSGHDLIKDPAFTVVDMQSTELFNVVQSLVFAGIKTEAAIKGTEPLEKSEVTKYIMCIDVADVTDLLWKIIACISGVTVDELKAVPVEEKKTEPEPVGIV